MTAIVQSFKDHLYQVGYGIGTQKMLPGLVSEFIHQQAITGISFIEQEKVKSFYEYLQTRPLKKRSGALSEMMIYHYVYALKTFFSWLEITEQIGYNPISGMKFKRPKINTREPLITLEIQQLFAVATTLKQQAILHLFYSCGLRRTEGQMLNIQDVHFKQQLLYVREGKGAKRRVIPMPAKVTAALENYYLNERCNNTSQKAKDTAAFLLNRTGARMKGNQCNRMLQQLKEKAALQKEITLHHLRHSIATHLLQSGMSMEYVKDFLGHSFLETTQIYAKAKTEQLKLL